MTKRRLRLIKALPILQIVLAEMKGIIAITHKSIQETRCWEEERVTIYLDEQRVDFDVWFKQPNWEYNKDYEDYDQPAFKDLPVIE